MDDAILSIHFTVGAVSPTDISNKTDHFNYKGEKVGHQQSYITVLSLLLYNSILYCMAKKARL